MITTTSKPKLSQLQKILFISELIICLIFGVSTVLIFITSVIISKKLKNKRLLLFTSIALLVSLLFSSILINNIETPIKDGLIGYIVFTICNLCIIVSQIHAIIKYKNQTDVIKANQNCKNKNLKLVLISAFAIIIIVLVSVLALPVFDLKIEDTNGIDNYSLQQLTDVDFLDLYGKNTAYHISESNSGLSSGPVECPLYDYDEIRYKAKTFTGIKTLQSTNAYTQTLEIVVDSKIKKGNGRIVVVIDNEIYDDFVINSVSKITIPNALNKKIYVVVGGESAEIELKITRNFRN